MLERLDKILASQGLGSRKEVRALIRNGAVAVNGIVQKKEDVRTDGDADDIYVNGKRLCFKRYQYIMMNKPGGVVSASSDSKMRTVVDLVPASLFRRGLFPAGRLDRDTEGLLIITDDGDFAHRMLAPKNHVYKLYEAVVDGSIGEKEIELFKKGICFADGTLCLPAELTVLKQGEHPLTQVRICEGKFHQVKKMFLAIGREVLYLKRVKIGQLALDETLPAGMCREITSDELKSIFEQC